MTDRALLLKRLKIAIKILVIVFIVSFAALAARIIYVSFYADRGTTVIVPDNILAAPEEEHPLKVQTLALWQPVAEDALPDSLCSKPTAAAVALASESTATVVELFAGQSADNDAFRAENMFPGDTVTKRYCLKVYHKADVAVYFKVIITDQTKALSNILNITVTRQPEDASEGQVICSGTFAELDGQRFGSVVTAGSGNETVVYYRIDVTLPASAGNEYQGAALSANFAWYAELPAHVCESECDICGKCRDPHCKDAACAEKCPGHAVIPPNPPAHSCQSECPVCGKCLDADCTEDACAEKCPGHAVHSCQSVCPICGKCLDEDCTEEACAEKCPGHAVIPPDPPAHSCQSVCPICGKCLDEACTEEACAEKCPGHSGEGRHECETKCERCGKCMDLDCPAEECAEKCPGHSGVVLVPKPKKYLIWPWTILPALSLTSLIVLIIIYRKNQREDDDEAE